MLVFWIIVALLMLLALWFVLPPLFASDEDANKSERQASNLSIYQNQYQELEADLRNGLIAEEQYQREKEELERRLLDDVKSENETAAQTSAQPNRKLGYAVAAAIPLAAIAFYLAIGSPKAVSSPPSTSSSAAPSQDGGPMSQQQIAANVDRLAQRLQQNPNDLQGWLMLGRSYLMLDRVSDGAAAYDHVLQLDPKNQNALMMGGAAYFQIKNYQKAIDYWQTVLPLLPANSDEARAVADQLSKAKQLAGSQPSR
jgi:cytochrome c-type biogenesis protein CcmH